MTEPLPPLIWAAIRADGEAVASALAAGADPDVADDNGTTALIHAALQGHLAIVEVLLAAGATPGRANRAGEDALRLAARAGHATLAERLIAAGADPVAAAAWALSHGLVDAFEIVLRAGPDVLAISGDQAPLMLAVRAQDLACIDRVLSLGANPDVRDDIGNTPLAHAAIAGRMDLIDRLIAAGATLDAPSQYAETALSLAIMRGHEAAAARLVAAGANIRYAYAHVAALSGDEAAERRARTLLPETLRALADEGRLGVALADDDTLAALDQEGDVLIGMTVNERSLDRSVIFTQLPAAVGRILVEDVPAHMQSLLRHIAVPGVIDREIVVVRRGDDGVCERTPMRFDSPAAVAARDGYEVRAPLGVEVEPINWCNLRCRYCHVSFMDRPPIKRIEAEDLAHLGALKNCFVQIGAAFEPTLNKGFAGIVDFFQAGDCEISVITNASLLTDEMIEAMARANLYSVQISFDAGTKDTYESIRRKSDFVTATGNIAKLRRRLREAGRDTFILLSVVLMRSNIDELPACIDLAEELGANLLGFQFMVTRFDDGTDALVDESLDPILPHAYARLDEAAEYAIANRKNILVGGSYYAHTPLRRRYPNQILNGLVIPNPESQPKHFLNKYVHLQIGHHPKMGHNCVSPYTFARIHADGDVSVCRDFILGNVKRQRFEDVWFGPVAHFVREFLIANPVVCAHCEHYKFCLQPATVNIDDPNHMGNNVDRTSDVANRLRQRRVGNDIVAAAAVSPWLSAVFEVIHADDTAALVELLATAAPGAVDLGTADGLTPLMFAVTHRRVGALNALLAGGVDTNLADNHGCGPLVIALSQGVDDIVEALVAHGARLDEALTYAVEHDALELARRALARGVSPNLMSEGGTPLVHVALSRSNAVMAKLLIEAGADPNATDPNGTPLARAAAMGAKWLVELLLDHGADIDAVDAQGSSALARAAALGRREVMDTLLARGASLALSPGAPRGDRAAQLDWRDDGGATPLIRAVSSGHLSLVETLLDHGADVDATDAQGSTALARAAAMGRRDMMDVLLARGASLALSPGAPRGDRAAQLEWRDDGGATPLIRAVSSGHLSLVETLLDHGADVDATDAQGSSPLIRAAALGRRDMMDALLARGASLALSPGAPRDDRQAQLDWRDGGGATALIRAVLSGQTPLVETLLDHGAAVDATDGHGSGALIHAAVHGRADLVDLLLGGGADAGRLNASDQDAAHIAARQGHHAVAARLIEAGADALRVEAFTREAPAWLERYRAAWERRVGTGAEALSPWAAALFKAIVADDEAAFTARLGDNQPEADPTLAFVDGVTPLMMAAARDRLMMARRLLDRGVDINAHDRFANTALSMALARSRDQMADTLMERGADVGRALSRGVVADHVEIVRGAIDRGADINARSTLSGEAQLITALFRGRIAAAEILCDAGATLDCRDRLGRTPLIWAAAIPGAEHLVPKMLARGADPSIRDADGRSHRDFLKMRGLSTD